MTPAPPLTIYAGQLSFVLPYIKAALPGREVRPAAQADICLLAPGESLPHDAPSQALVLHCAHVIGTGMRGLPRLMAEAIASGRYVLAPAFNRPISVIHAADVAAAVALAADTRGKRYFLSDGAPTDTDSLAHALAKRINDRRLYALKPWLARIMMPRPLARALAAATCFDDKAFATDFPAFSPTPVAQYMATHVYDESSL